MVGIPDRLRVDGLSLEQKLKFGGLVTAVVERNWVYTKADTVGFYKFNRQRLS